MHRLLAAFFVVILMLSHGSVGAAHEHRHGHHVHGVSTDSPGHDDHHDAIPEIAADSTSADDFGSSDATQPVAAHVHVVGDMAPAPLSIARSDTIVRAAPPYLRAEQRPVSATVPPPLKPPAA